MTEVIHYADEDRNLQPLCRSAQDGDLMTFFDDQVTCQQCLKQLDQDCIA